MKGICVDSCQRPVTGCSYKHVVHGLLTMSYYHSGLQVVGMITRKDVAEANAKLALGRKANLGLTTPSERLTRSSGLPFIPYGAYDPTVGLASPLWPTGEGEEDSQAVDQRRCAAISIRCIL